MRIGAPALREIGGAVRLQASLEDAAGPGELWYGADRDWAGALSPARADAFLAGGLLRAMRTGEDIHVAAPVSARLVYQLQHYLQPILCLQMPGLRRVRIHAEELATEGLPGAAAVGTGFSAGVDSYAVIHDHLVAEVTPGYRLTHLVFNNVGSHGHRDPAAARELFARRHGQLRGGAELLGLPFIQLDSNLSEVLRMDFEQTHTLRNLAAVLALQGLFRRYYYAGSFQYRDCHLGPTFDAAFADPAAVHLLSTETTDMVAAGGRHRRLDKLRMLTAVPGATGHLNVCTNAGAGGRNCGRCLKCTRTMLGLEMLGTLEAFAACLPLDTWSQVRNRYISGTVLQPGPLPLTRELLEFAAATGYRFTAWQRFMARVIRVTPRPLYRLARSVRRRLLEGGRILGRAGRVAE